MAQKDDSKSGQVAAQGNSGSAWIRWLLAAVLTLGLLSAGLQNCRAESPASKNNEGNRLYERGKYSEAEKAYLSAQVDSPGKPQILYNLGNSLVKQKKYREGVQALGQSIDKGDKGIKEKGWYNTGNALFSAGDYRNSADAFIQALKLDPADRDAKYNLELALLKMKQQEQQKESEKNQKKQDKQDSKNSGMDKSSKGQDSGKQNGADQAERNRQQKAEENRSAQHERSLTKERAIQLLDAVQNQEREEQRKLMERRASEKANGKDW